MIRKLKSVYGPGADLSFYISIFLFSFLSLKQMQIFSSVIFFCNIVKKYRLSSVFRFCSKNIFFYLFLYSDHFSAMSRSCKCRPFITAFTPRKLKKKKIIFLVVRPLRWVVGGGVVKPGPLRKKNFVKARKKTKEI